MKKFRSKVGAAAIIVAALAFGATACASSADTDWKTLGQGDRVTVEGLDDLGSAVVEAAATDLPSNMETGLVVRFDNVQREAFFSHNSWSREDVGTTTCQYLYWADRPEGTHPTRIFADSETRSPVFATTVDKVPFARHACQWTKDSIAENAKVEAEAAKLWDANPSLELHLSGQVLDGVRREK